MRYAIALLLLALPYAAAIEQHGNSVNVALPGGWAKLEWLSEQSFRFCRGWERPSGCPDLANREPVKYTARDLATELELVSGQIRVRVEKSTGRITVAMEGGPVLLEETSLARRKDSGVVARFRSSASEKFQGLGMRDGPVFLQGLRLTTWRPYLFSNRGYALYFPAPCRHEFDLGSTDRSVIQVHVQQAKHLEYFFYQGGTPKEVFEAQLGAPAQVERMNSREVRLSRPSEWPPEAAPLPDFGPASWTSLRAAVRALINGSLSGMLLPAWDLAPWRGSPEELHHRAAQLAVFIPLLGDSTTAGARTMRPPLDPHSALLRARLIPYLLTYTLEAHQRGFPVIHPLPMQFPGDTQGASLEDQFLFGDEILVAPALDTTGRRKVYLPMGLWTDLWSNVSYKGRQTVDLVLPEHAPAMLIKNGSLIPLLAERAGDPVELHYFPSLGSEFFLAEEGLWNPTQFHASPAGDYYRLETESQRDRDYEWVAHHLTKPSKVVEGDDVYLEVADRTMLANGCWYYDTDRGNLHVRQAARAGADQVINIAF